MELLHVVLLSLERSDLMGGSGCAEPPQLMYWV